MFVEAANVDAVLVKEKSYHVGWAWYTLIIFVIQILAAGIDISIVTLLVHPIESTFRINDVGFAAITAIPVAIGIAVAYYPAGLLADTFRRRDMIATGALIWALAALLAARTDSGTMFFVARLLAGIGTGVPGPAIFSILSDSFPRTRRALAVSVYAAGYSIGGGIGIAICGALVMAAQHNGTLRISGMLFSPWQQCFIAVAAIGVALLALMLTVPEPPRRDRSMHGNANLTASLRLFGQYIRRNARLWTSLLLAYPIGWTSYYGIATWGPTFGMRHFGITGAASIGLLGVFTAAGSLLGSILGGLFAQRGINHGDPRVLPRMLVGVSAISCITAGISYMPSWLLAVVGIGVLLGATQISAVLISIAIQETAPNEVRGQLNGVLGLIFSIPLIAGPMLVAFLASGVFAKAGGLQPALAVVIGVAGVLTAILYALSGAPYKRAVNEMALNRIGG